MAYTVAVIGGGVAGLASAMHLVELWQARRAADLPTEPLRICLLAPLVPTGGDGSGLGGKAMSRSYAGPVDAQGNERAPIYGPMMPERGTVPHGYHVLWEYPNLRRMLGDGAPDEPSPALDGGLLRPRGGAGALAVFQGRIDDPTPGGPGIALMGLSDPDRPETATLPVTQALYRLQDSRFAGVFLEPFRALFAELAEGIDPLFYADLFYAHEVDLELRLALVAASLVARTTDPESATVDIDGRPQPLWAVEYDRWLQVELERWGGRLLARLEQPPLRGWLDELAARGWIVESQLEGEPGGGLLRELVRAALPPEQERALADLVLVARETERILREVPGALSRLVSGGYRVTDTLHFRFGPDSTFTSPYSYDAATAVRSLAFVFTSPRSARVWSADGARMHRLWLRLWQRLQQAAAATGQQVELQVLPGRATALRQEGDRVEVSWATIVGHGHGPGSDLGWPHDHRLEPWRSPLDEPRTVHADLAVTAVAPPNLRAILAPEHTEARAVAQALEPHHNTSLELLVWTRERIEYGETARRGLAGSSITGLEGGWCLLADYSQGLWSEAALAEEDPFGDGRFRGSVLESCGSWADVYAVADRSDAFGWPTEVKSALADLLSRPEDHARHDGRAWVEDPGRWRDRVAAGQWRTDRLQAPAAGDDWVVASRWLTWQFLRQLARIQALGPRAVRQLGALARLLDPRGVDRSALLQPPEALRAQVRYVVMVNAKPRNRIFSPSAGTWPLRPVSGLPLPGTSRILPAGDWTRNGLDVICMEAATLSGMRAARAAHRLLLGERPPVAAPSPVPVLPRASWYAGVDPLARGEADAASAWDLLGVRS